METDWASLPVGADPSRDMPVGQNEFGGLVYRTMSGQEYTIQPQAVQPAREGGVMNRLAAMPGNMLRGTANALASGFTAPGRALAGEAVTNGDAWNTAGMAQFGAAPMKAPAGALRSGAMGSQSVSDQILDLLKSGKGKSVTDDMMAAADPEYLYRNYDLPMDQASRMTRAREMGFEYARRSQSQNSPFNDVDYAMFAKIKGNADDAFDGLENYGPGQWIGRADAEVQSVQPDIIRAFRDNGRNAEYSTTAAQLAREANPENIVDSAGMWDNPDLASDAISAIDARGIGAVATRDGLIAWNPRNIRSRFARFDPRLAHLANLSAAGAGVAYVNELSGQGDDALLAYLQSRGM